MDYVGWTDERVEQVRNLWRAGHSAGAIASMIGNTTRNAVIGKVSRLGLPGRKVTVRRPPNDRWNTEDRRMERGDRPFKQSLKPRTPKPDWRAEPLPETPVTDIARVATADLEPHHCRWPVGDPKRSDFGYCGCQKIEGLSYCSTHARRAYTVPETKPKPLYGHINAVITSETAKHLNAKEFAES